MADTPTSQPSWPAGKIQRLHLFEFSLYAIVFTAALGIPFFLDVYTNFGWKGVWFDWMRLLPFILILLVSNYLLVPKLLFKEKYLWYVLGCMVSIVVVVYLSGFLIELTRAKLKPFETITPYRNMPPPPFFGKPPVLFFNVGLAIIAFLLIGFNTGIKSFVRWSEEKVRQAEKERQHYYTELAFLKHQISPHFFMNTLNNIHALVDINTHEAKNAIIKLSHLMRYLLYESDMQKVSLKKEIDFIESYIELMRLRYNKANLKIKTIYPKGTETVYVPSSLFLSFIENAFKHGIHPHEPSIVCIKFVIENDQLTFNVVNPLQKGIVSPTESTGIGLENVYRRLDLIYGKNYLLHIEAKDGVYQVTLKIPIS